MHILNLEKSVEFDESITHYQERNILPKTGTNYGKLGEIRFVLQNPEIYNILQRAIFILRVLFRLLPEEDPTPPDSATMD